MKKQSVSEKFESIYALATEGVTTISDGQARNADHLLTADELWAIKQVFLRIREQSRTWEERRVNDFDLPMSKASNG